MKLLIVEDEHKVVDYLRSGLTEQGWIVDVALDGEEGTHLAIEFDYDVIVLDVMLPKRDGFSVLKALRAHKATPVIMLTARDQINDRVRGLREGADDYLTKPFSFLELVERLHALARRTRVQESTLISLGDLYVDLIGRRATRDGVRLDLTAKEFQLLSVLARRQGDILSKTAITELVWDVNFDSHMARFRPSCCIRCAAWATCSKSAKKRGHHESINRPASRFHVRGRRVVCLHAGRNGSFPRVAHATRTAFARVARRPYADRTDHRVSRGHA